MTEAEELLKRVMGISNRPGDMTGSVVWNPPLQPGGFQSGGLVPVTPAPSYQPFPFPSQPLPPPAWPDNTLIRELLVRMDKELAEALKVLLKRLDKIDEVVGRIEQAGRYSS